MNRSPGILYGFRARLTEVEDIDTRLMKANGIIDGYFSTRFKHWSFFDALTDIAQVIVLGHSLSDVDAANFLAMQEQRSEAEAAWLIACRSPEEWSEKQSLLSNLGGNPSKTLPVD